MATRHPVVARPAQDLVAPTSPPAWSLLAKPEEERSQLARPPVGRAQPSALCPARRVEMLHRARLRRRCEPSVGAATRRVRVSV